MVPRTQALVYEFLFLIACIPHGVYAATLFFPAAVSVHPGDKITETLRVNTDQAINAISGTVTFPSGLLHVNSVSKSGSILSLWVQDPSFSNTDGTVTWSGVVPNPGYMGNNGRVFSIQFVAIKSGTAKISFSSAQVLANDGNGTDVLTGTNPTTISIPSTPGSQTSTVPILPASKNTIKTYAPSMVTLNPIQELPTSQRLAVSGTIYSSAPVTLTLIDTAGGTSTEKTVAQDSGVLAYTWPLILPPGAYTLLAQSVDEHSGKLIGADPVHFSVTAGPQIPPSSRSNYYMLALLAALTLVIGILILWLLQYRQVAHKNRKLYRIHALLHEEFGTLRQDIIEEVRALEYVKTKRKLSEEEGHLIERLKKMLDRAERVIDKSID